MGQQIQSRCGTMTGLFGKYKNRIVSSYMVVRKKDCTPTKKENGQNKVVYTEVEGEMGFKQMFTHVLGFSNHKHIAWVFVQENKQRLHRCPLAIYKTPQKSECSTLRTEMGPNNCGHFQGWRKWSGQSVGQEAAQKDCVGPEFEQIRDQTTKYLALNKGSRFGWLAAWLG